MSTHLDATRLLPFCFDPALNVVTGWAIDLPALLIGVYWSCVCDCVCIVRCVQICHQMRSASALAPSFWADKEFAAELWWTSSVQSFYNRKINHI